MMIEKRAESLPLALGDPPVVSASRLGQTLSDTSAHDTGPNDAYGSYLQLSAPLAASGVR
jgi:hypothetical protein